MNSLPVWAQWVALVGAAFLALLQTYFLVFVLWPSVRRGRRLTDKIDRALDEKTIQGIQSLAGGKERMIDRL